MATAKKDVAGLVDHIRDTPGWTVGTNAAAHWVFTNTNTNESMAMSPTPSSIPSVKGRLKRMGWDPDAAEMAREEKRAAVMKEQREKEARMLVDAEEHAAKVLAEEQAAQEETEAAAKQARAAQTEALRAQARQLNQAAKAAAKKTKPTPLGLFAEVVSTTVDIQTPPKPRPAPKPALNIPVFMAPGSPKIIVPEDDEEKERIGHRILAACRTERIFVGKEWAEIALDREDGACRQRHVYDTNVATIQRDIERGAFYGNPADHLVFDEHGCLVNGQHRAWAIVNADPEKFAKHYPHGVEVYVAHGFDSRFCHIFDSGKSRSVTDSLAVDGIKGFGDSHAASLRALMNYDLSFQVEADDPRRKWRNWSKNVWTKDEYSEAAKNLYARLPEYNKLASHVFKKGGAVHTSVATAAFLLDRDNPDGSERGTNEEFWAGVCFEVPLAPDDPRAALYRHFQNVRGDKNKPPMIGLAQTAQILRQYANFHIGEKVTQVQTAYDSVMAPVWQKDFRWFAGGELRKTKYPNRVPARLKSDDTAS